MTGITQADYSRLTNNGKDYTQLKGFDTAARTIASEFPDLGIGRGYEDEWGYDDTDYAAVVWDLIGEGKQTPPARHDPELLDEAAQLVRDARKHRLDADLANIPFSAGAGG